MKGAVWVLLLLIALPAAAAKPRFALVIGNNQPENAREGTLRYADDDAVATHRLLVEAGVHSVLLTRFDADTARLASGVAPAGPPTWPEVSRALHDLYDRMRAAGHDSELLLFYSGHGDVVHGEGYVNLEGQRLTRRMLYHLLERSPAHRNHVIIDACKSFFLVFGRSPGGARSTYGAAFDDGQLPSALDNTGFVLSTSSDRDSHEWERFSAGIFSHELRSALRGAADVDRDGRISYAELGAFLVTANRAIDNSRFRPDFFVRPPEHALGSELLTWAGDSVASVPGSFGHVYVEDAAGVRVLDAHAPIGVALALRLPAERPLFVRSSSDAAEYALVAPGAAQVGELPLRVPATAPKGALHLAFDRLFAVPFGAAEVTAFSGEQEAAERRLSLYRVRLRHRNAVRLGLGVSALALVTVSLLLGVVTLERYLGGRDLSQADRAQRNDLLIGLEPTLGVTLGAAGAASAAWLALTLKWR